MALAAPRRAGVVVSAPLPCATPAVPAARRTGVAARVALALAAAFACAVALLVAAALLGLDDAPRVTPPPAAAPDDSGAAALRRMPGRPGQRDARAAAAGALRSAVLSQREVELLIDQAAGRYLPSATRVALRPGAAVVRSSVALPANLFGSRWLNVEATLRDGALPPKVAALRIGRLALPAWLGDAALRRLADRLDARLAADDAGAGTALRLLGATVRSVSFGAGEARLVYEWRADSRERLAAALLSAAGAQRAHAYGERLAALLAAAAPAPTVSLARLLAPMFALARERSTDAAGAARENRAAILTLALHATGRGGLAAIADARAPRRPVITLAGRDDFPQHWLVSAALAVEAGGPLADAIGLYKELDDRRQGSGFSFNDIAADRAGTRFGLRAVEAPAALQARVAAGVGEADLLPEVADLPEFMSAAEFARRYGSVGSPAYARLLEAIEARVAALAVLR